MEWNLYNNATRPWEESVEDVDVLEDNELTCQLVLWNDDFNTFDWVIETLIEICHQTPEQAEQCAIFIHTKGKYGVKNGDYKDLKPMRDAILDRGINATIERKK